jgi:ribonuclease Z
MCQSKKPGLQVRTTAIDHGVLALAFALEERAHINIWRNEAMGLLIGPWLRTFKEATLGGAPDDSLIDVKWRDRHSGKPTPSLSDFSERRS